MKGHRGITILALVVTVILLLILVGVVLNLTLGNNGIIGKAQDAGKKWKNAEQEELADLENLDRYILYEEDGLGDSQLNSKDIGDFKTFGVASNFIVLSTDASNYPKGEYYIKRLTENIKKAEMDLTDVDINKIYYIAIGCQNSNGAEHTEVTIQKVWLEK